MMSLKLIVVVAAAAGAATAELSPAPRPDTCQAARVGDVTAAVSFGAADIKLTFS